MLTFEEALPIVKQLVEECDEGEQLRLLECFCGKRPTELNEGAQVKRTGGNQDGDRDHKNTRKYRTTRGGERNG